MAEPVNLNRFKKHKARADKKARADQNAAKFGRTKTEKQRDMLAEKTAKNHLDAHKRDDR
ncbi:DUF4169 family protein [Cognatishimia sp. WU-CL00825]|uniref:DUF4169 family protein n=1 Tax=Cognatishimia sp. WU-CL00825 TaxID=3127658 RepID=UPI003104D913